jgi:hypothetical protein
MKGGNQGQTYIIAGNGKRRIQVRSLGHCIHKIEGIALLGFSKRKRQQENKQKKGSPAIRSDSLPGGGYPDFFIPFK